MGVVAPPGMARVLGEETGRGGPRPRGRDPFRRDGRPARCPGGPERLGWGRVPPDSGEALGYSWASSVASSISGGSGHDSPARSARRSSSSTLLCDIPQLRAMARALSPCSPCNRRISRILRHRQPPWPGWRSSLPPKGVRYTFEGSHASPAIGVVQRPLGRPGP